MNCPECQHRLSQCIDSRADPLLVRRRRQCLNCKARWTTYEMDVATIERLKAGELGTFEREQIISILSNAMDLISSTAPKQPLKVLHGSRMRLK